MASLLTHFWTLIFSMNPQKCTFLLLCVIYTRELATLSYVFWSLLKIFMFLNLFNMQHAVKNVAVFCRCDCCCRFVENWIKEKNCVQWKKVTQIDENLPHAVDDDDDSMGKNSCACAGWWKHWSESILQSVQLNNIYSMGWNGCKIVQAFRQKLELWSFFSSLRFIFRFFLPCGYRESAMLHKVQ